MPCRRSHPRSLLVALLGVFIFLALSRPAEAQLGTGGTLGTTTTATLADGDIFIGIQQTEGANLNQFDLARFFNKANCDCSTPVFLYYTLTSTGFSKRSLVPTGTVYFYIGSQCNDPILQKTNCQFLQSDQIATFMALGRETIATTARAMSANSIVSTTADGGTATSGTAPNPDCTSPVNGFNQTVWAIFDYGSDGTFDYSATQAVFVDLVPPPAPTNVLVKPGNEALTLTWTLIDYTVNMDLQGYQVYCERGAGLQVFSDNTFGAAARTCPTTVGTGLTALNPLFACSPLLNRSVDAFRVKILQNDIFYGATVVAIDNSGNATTPVLIGSMGPSDPNSSWQKPEKTDSFYDVYRDGNVTNGSAGQTATPGAATGGFCAVAGAGRAEDRRGRWVLGGAGLLVAAAIARGRRRRR